MMKTGPLSVRLVVMTVALLLAAVALAGCHDLTNDADPGTDPGEDGDGGTNGDDDADDDETEGDTEDDTQDDTEDDSEDDTETGSEEESESETEEEDPPTVEEGEFDADHTIAITTGVPPCGSDDFDPESLEIEVGETVKWDNEAGCSHTATSGDVHNEPDGLFDTGQIAAGEESENSYRFNEAGTYKYYCANHPDMPIAEIVVG